MSEEGIFVMTPEFRLGFHNLLKPGQNDEGDDKWDAKMLFAEGETLSELKEAATRLLTQKFGDKSNWPKGFRKPWRDQAEKDPENENAPGKTYEGYVSGNLFANCSTFKKPDVVDQKNKPIVDSSVIFSGVYMKAYVELKWYGDNPSSKGNKGIRLVLHCAQLQRTGEPLGGGVSVKAASVFKPISVNTKKDAGSAFDDDDDPMA